jgi:Tol biopolymer transport system component
VPALGGDARLIAPDGMMPRFSPDGRSIAFWTGNWLAPRGVVQARQAFVIPIDGGEPTRVAAGLASVGDPVWSPDGRALLVFGREATTGPNTRPEWWWMPLNGGAITPTGVYERLAEHGFQLNNTNTQPYPFAWSPQGVLFTATDAVAGAMDTAVTRSVWTIAIDQATGRVAGDPIRLTTGTTVDTSPSASREGQMVFAATTQHELIFGLPLDANAGRVTGPLRLLRADTAPTGRAGASEDGRLLVFPRYEVGAGGVWVRDLMTGRERQLAATPPTPLNPVISTDGNWVAYTVTTTERGGNAGPGVGYVVQTTGGAPRRVCEDCQIFQWSRDNRQLFIVEKTVLLNRLHVATGSRIPILAAAATAPTGDEEIDRPLLPPGERWIVFNTARKTFVAPLYPDRATPEEEWMAVYGHGGAERSAGLSPDGRLLYLLLERDGFRCLYALPVDPGNGHPIGEPFLVQHFHDPSRPWGSTGFGSATVAGMFVADLYEITGNVWMTTIE